MATKNPKKNSPTLDVYILHKDTQCTLGRVGDTRYFAFNPEDKAVKHKKLWPGIGFEDKAAVDGVIRRLQAISDSFNK